MTNPDGLKGGVYLLRIGPRRYYVGVANRFAQRHRQHLYHLRRGDHDNPVLQGSYNKHGEDSFRFDPIVWCDREEAARIEAWLIQSNAADENCANLRIEDGTTFTFSEEARRRMGEARRGRTLSEEHRRKIRDANLSRSPEMIRKIADAQRGRVHSEETRRKIADAQRGRVHSEETRRRMGEARRGRVRSEETRRKIGAANSRENLSPEARRRKSEAAKRRWAARKTAEANQTEEK